MSRTYRKIPTSQRSSLPGAHWFWSRAAQEHHRTVADYLEEAESERQAVIRDRDDATAASVIAGEESPATAVSCA